MIQTKKEENKWIFIKTWSFLWSNKEFAVYITPEFSIGWYGKHIHFEFSWLFWGINITIRTYKYK